MEHFVSIPDARGGTEGDTRVTAGQQPDWFDPVRLRRAREELSARPALVRSQDVSVLRHLLRRVATGEVQVLQAGDCAEDPAECMPDLVTRKVGLLDMLAGSMQLATGLPVLRVGRIAGQFAKPRSKPVEHVDGRELEVFRGHQVNHPEPDPDSRVADPDRLLLGYEAARNAMEYLGWSGPGGDEIDAPVWTSHEALLMDYELPMIRHDRFGDPILTSTHWPWIGERTNQLDGAHVRMLSQVCNPVACKVGPDFGERDLVELCGRLDPDHDPGRLTLIARLGADQVGERAPALARAVQDAGHPVIWLVDPMHGNTVPTGDGHKTRFVDDLIKEISVFQDAVREAGGICGGLHLEITPRQVLECVQDESEINRVGEAFLSLCDPRLNPEQALDVVNAWKE